MKQIKQADGDVGHMNEVPMYFDMPSSKTIDFTGVKTVMSKTTGYEKLRFSVALTILSRGRKFPPLIIFKNLKKVPKGKIPEGRCSYGGKRRFDNKPNYDSIIHS